ncbi:MAG: aldo/keto reductase [Pseudomonadota bacterium]
MRTVKLPDGETVQALGLGTWHMGERSSEHDREVNALKAGMDLGMTLIDTAEMYGEGGAEEVVGDAIQGRRDNVFIVSKVYPHNASRTGAIAACERSLKRMRIETIDLYLLHWRGGVPLSETVEAFEQLKSEGKIRHWGVSNLDAGDMDELHNVESGNNCATNQVLYHLGERGIEWDLLPDCAAAKIPVMAYSPLGQGAILFEPTLQQIGDKHGATPAAVAIAWVMRHEHVIAIPKSSDAERVRQNAAASDLKLDAEDLALLEDVFPPPNGPSRLAIL